MNTEDVIVAFRSPARRKGFAQIPTVVLLDKTLSDAAKVLYALLVSYAMQAGAFKVTQPAIADDMGKGERTVRTLTAELKKHGLIGVKQQGMMLPNIYYIEDAYALYDSEQPKVRQPVRTEKGVAKNGRSPQAASDRPKTAAHSGRKQPVIAAKNGRLLKNLKTKNLREEWPAAPGDSPAALPEGENGQDAGPVPRAPIHRKDVSDWESLTAAERRGWEERARQMFVLNGVGKPGARAVARQASVLWGRGRQDRIDGVQSRNGTIVR